MVWIDVVFVITMLTPLLVSDWSKEQSLLNRNLQLMIVFKPLGVGGGVLVFLRSVGVGRFFSLAHSNDRTCCFGELVFREHLFDLPVV